RIPGWSEETEMKINGEEVKVLPGTYAEITRRWESGDQIALLMDMRCKVINAPRGSNRGGDNFQAVVYGPMVLARDENIDINYNTPVTLQAENGYIDVKQENPQGGNFKLQFLVPVEDGKFITMVDYASVDNWNNGKHVCTWIPKK
ncbi:MAG: glycoside hydrolase family 127 protein, partial [Dysgonamonadaceae bacterium]|nr:glycoside hydrolase family 127 protein [Dysgonamonadaceae bacterium]